MMSFSCLRPRKLSSYAIVYINTLAPYRIDLTCFGSVVRKLGKVECLGAGKRSVKAVLECYA